MLSWFLPLRRLGGGWVESVKKKENLWRKFFSDSVEWSYKKLYVKADRKQQEIKH